MMVLCVVLTSCNGKVRSFVGDYSYKLSGDVVFTDSEGEEVHSVQSQRGQMNILRGKRGECGNVVITVNQMDGSVYSFNATVKGDSLILDEHDCEMEFSSLSTDPDLTQVKRPYKVHVSGRGILHDNMLILEERWTGKRTDGSSNTLVSNKINVLAEQND